MNKEVIAARIAENQAKLAELKESRKLLIAQNKDAIQEILRVAVAKYVETVEGEVINKVCGDAMKDIDAQIKRVEEDLEIFSSLQ